MKLKNTKDKKILKSARQRGKITYERRAVKVITDFSAATTEQKLERPPSVNCGISVHV